MVDGCPAALCLATGCSEAHGINKIIGDVAPLLVRQCALFGPQTQRAVPDTGVLVANVNALFLGRIPLHVLDLNGNTEQLAWLVEVLGNGKGVIPVQHAVVVPAHDGCITSHQVRLAVCILGLVRVGRCQVNHQATHARTAGDVRNHSLHQPLDGPVDSHGHGPEMLQRLTGLYWELTRGIGLPRELVDVVRGTGKKVVQLHEFSADCAALRG